MCCMMEHWLIILMLALIWGAYQQTVTNSTHDRTVKQHTLNNWMHALDQRRYTVMKRYYRRWRPLFENPHLHVHFCFCWYIKKASILVITWEMKHKFCTSCDSHQWWTTSGYIRKRHKTTPHIVNRVGLYSSHQRSQTAFKPTQTNLSSRLKAPGFLFSRTKQSWCECNPTHLLHIWHSNQPKGGGEILHSPFFSFSLKTDLDLDS